MSQIPKEFPATGTCVVCGLDVEMSLTEQEANEALRIAQAPSGDGFVRAKMNCPRCSNNPPGGVLPGPRTFLVAVTESVEVAT